MIRCPGDGIWQAAQAVCEEDAALVFRPTTLPRFGILGLIHGFGPAPEVAPPSWLLESASASTPGEVLLLYFECGVNPLRRSLIHATLCRGWRIEDAPQLQPQTEQLLSRFRQDTKRSRASVDVNKPRCIVDETFTSSSRRQACLTSRQ